jgi:hypothetical protein
LGIVDGGKGMGESEKLALFTLVGILALVSIREFHCSILRGAAVRAAVSAASFCLNMGVAMAVSYL